MFDISPLASLLLTISFSHDKNFYWSYGKFTLKRKFYLDEIFVTVCTGNNNKQCNQWRKFRRNDDSFVSVPDQWCYTSIINFCNSIPQEVDGAQKVPDILRENTKQYNIYIIQYNTIQHNTIQWNTNNTIQHKQWNTIILCKFVKNRQH